MSSTPLALSTLLTFTVLVGCATPSPPAAQASAQGNLSAPTQGSAGPTSITVPDAQSEDVIESARSSVRWSAEWLARGVDSWFGDRPFEEGGSVTDGRLSLSTFKRQGESADTNLRFNARFRLPNVEEKTYLFIGRDNTRDVITDRPGSFSQQERLLSDTAAEQGFFAGLGRTISDVVDFRLGFRGGLKPYVQGRYRRPWNPRPSDLVEFRQTVFWSVDNHLGSTTALSYEHAFSPVLASRWLSAATISQTSRKFEWNSSLGAYRSLGDQRVLSIEALISGKQGSGVGLTDYGLQTRWEQPVHKDWLLGQVVVGHFWPRPDELSPRRRAWALGAGLKMRF
jgi:hypothetical protein